MYGSTVRIKGVGSNYQYFHGHSVSIAMKLNILGAVATSPSPVWCTTTTTTRYGPFEKRTTNRFEPTVKTEVLADEPVKCGDTIRLEHVLTKRNLHSESLFMSMITEAQEVSAFGSDGLGDESNSFTDVDDNWIISCQGQPNEALLLGGYTFDLIH